MYTAANQNMLYPLGFEKSRIMGFHREVENVSEAADSLIKGLGKHRNLKGQGGNPLSRII